MIWLLAAAALAADPVDEVAALFPGAEVTQVQGKRAIAPIRRQGKAGYILADDVSSVDVSGGRHLVAFRLQVADVPVDGIEAAVTEVGTWTRVLQVALLSPEGAFIAKPDGFPIEKEVDLHCLGDFCVFGPEGRLEPVADSTTWAVLRWSHGEAESMGMIKPLHVEGDTVKAFPDVEDGSAGGLTGCEWRQVHESFREKDGKLKAVRMRSCGGGNEECAEICKESGYPTEDVIQPVTLAP